MYYSTDYRLTEVQVRYKYEISGFGISRFLWQPLAVWDFTIVHFILSLLIILGSRIATRELRERHLLVVLAPNGYISSHKEGLPGIADDVLVIIPQKTRKTDYF